MTMAGIPGKLLREDRGTSAVEFAIVSGAFFSFIIGIAIVGIMLFNNLSLSFAVQKAARSVAVNNAQTQSQIASQVNGYMTSVGLSNAAVTYTTSVLNNVTTGHIAASYVQAYTIPFITTFNITFQSDAYVPIQSS